MRGLMPPISDSTADREHAKFADVAGIPAVRVANADGSAISAGGGGGTSSVDDSAFTPGASSVTPVGFLADEVGPDSVDEGDVGLARMSLDRMLYVTALLASDVLRAGGASLTPKFAAISTSASGNTEVVAAVASKKIRVLRLTVVANAAVNVKFQSAAADRTGLHYLAANGGWVEGFCPVGVFETAAGEALNINLSGAVAVGGTLTYVEVP